MFIDVVNEHSGIVNKFLGDGFMAVFGAPMDDEDRCQHAVDAAMDILQRLDALNRSKAIPHTRIGVGLHAGRLMTGNVGTSQRKEYTLIGETVNLASRIEMATKEYRRCRSWCRARYGTASRASPPDPRIWAWWNFAVSPARCGCTSWRRWARPQANKAGACCASLLRSAARLPDSAKPCMTPAVSWCRAQMPPAPHSTCQPPSVPGAGGSTASG